MTNSDTVPGEGHTKVADELRRLSGCEDIPRYRRKQLLRLALELAPEPFPPPEAEPDVFHDGYYRRPGLRMKAVRTDDSNSAPTVAPLLIEAQP